MILIIKYHMKVNLFKSSKNDQDISVSKNFKSCRGHSFNWTSMQLITQKCIERNDGEKFSRLEKSQNDWFSCHVLSIRRIRKADLYTEKGSYLWDVAAGAAIVNAAGGRALILNQNDKFQVGVFFSNSNLEL